MANVRSLPQPGPRQSTTRWKPVMSRSLLARMAARCPRADALAAAIARTYREQSRCSSVQAGTKFDTMHRFLHLHCVQILSLMRVLIVSAVHDHLLLGPRKPGAFLSPKPGFAFSMTVINAFALSDYHCCDKEARRGSPTNPGFPFDGLRNSTGGALSSADRTIPIRIE